MAREVLVWRQAVGEDETRADEKVTAPSDRPQARIDQVLLGRDLPRPVSAEAIATGASDHALVVVEI